MVFTYDSTYINDPESAAFSVSLPLEKVSFDPHITRTFFEGMLRKGL